MLFIADHTVKAHLICKRKQIHLNEIMDLIDVKTFRCNSEQRKNVMLLEIEISLYLLLAYVVVFGFLILLCFLLYYS